MNTRFNIQHSSHYSAISCYLALFGVSVEIDSLLNITGTKKVDLLLDNDETKGNTSVGC